MRKIPPLEASGFVGIGFLGANVQLGDSWAPEQIPGNAPLFGLRLTLLLAPHLADVSLTRRFQFGIELETQLAASNTRTTIEREGRMTYFAPVFGWRAHAMLRYVDDTLPLRPHLVLGGGGATVASESPYMRKETDPVAYYGGGLSLPLTAAWHVRIEARHGVLPARNGGISSIAELQFGIAGSFGFPEKRTPARVAEPSPEQPTVDETDSDQDGLPDRIDRCPAARETVNGVADGDGCPEPDADGDGLLGAMDACPDLAEDLDSFEDDDGCPDADNDRDGIEDRRDACPLEAETRNGFDDEDGCPDGTPTEVTKALAAASAIVFEPNRARVTSMGAKALGPLLELLLARKTLKVMISGRPATAATTNLAKRRADAVKWYLIDQGVAAERFRTQLVAAGKGGAVELALTLE